jgi:hypothetical protein
MRGLLVAFAMLCPAHALADGLEDPVRSDDYRVDHFMERMYIGPRFSAKAEANGFDLFEARIAPHLFFYQTANRLVTPNAKGYTQGFSTAFTPALRLRMTNSDSNPVRTPSFNPQFLNYAHFWLWGMHENHGEWNWNHDGDTSGRDAGVHMLALTYTIAHHSNGQEDCTYQPADGPCPTPPFTTIPEVNTRTGNYGTNYEDLGVHYKWLKLGPGDTTRGFVTHTTYSASVVWERYQWNPVAQWLPGGLGGHDEPLRPIFGLHRLAATGEMEKLVNWCWFSRARLRADLTWISGPEGNTWSEPSGRISVDGAALFTGMGGFGMFARVFYGQDYFNIRLRDVAPMAIVGFTWESAPMQKFKPGRAAVQDGGEPQPVMPGTSSAELPLPQPGDI